MIDSPRKQQASFHIRRSRSTSIQDIIVPQLDARRPNFYDSRTKPCQLLLANKLSNSDIPHIGFQHESTMTKTNTALYAARMQALFPCVETGVLRASVRTGVAIELSHVDRTIKTLGNINKKIPGFLLLPANSSTQTGTQYPLMLQ